MRSASLFKLGSNITGIKRVSGFDFIALQTSNPLGRGITTSSNARSIESPSTRASACWPFAAQTDRKSTRLNSSHLVISYAVFCLKKKTEDYSLRLLVDDDLGDHAA